MRLLACVAALAMMASEVKADCAAHLATGIDISGSVSSDELTMQVDGITDALQSPPVISAFSSSGCTSIAVFVWGENHFVTLLPWTDIASAEDAENAVANLHATVADYHVPPGQLTNTEGALKYAWQLFGQIPPTGRQILNIVTNGVQNVGYQDAGPAAVSLAMRSAGITINGLAFGPSAEVDQWLRENVTGGVGSFVLRVARPEDFPAVWRSKFILDLSMVMP
jgi:hypothetical protein